MHLAQQEEASGGAQKSTTPNGSSWGSSEPQDRVGRRRDVETVADLEIGKLWVHSVPLPTLSIHCMQSCMMTLCSM